MYFTRAAATYAGSFLCGSKIHVTYHKAYLGNPRYLITCMNKSTVIIKGIMRRSYTNGSPKNRKL